MQSAAASLTPHLLRLLDHLPLMVFAKHAHDLSFAFFNQAGAALIGVPAQALLGKTDHDFFPKEQADFFVARDKKVLESGELDIVEEPIETAQGLRLLRTRKVALHDKDGAPRFLLGISEDITDRKEAEAALKASHRALEETLAQLMAMEPLAVAGWQAQQFARELKTVATRGRKTTLIDLVGAFADAMGGGATPADHRGTVELNEVLTHAAQGRPIKVEVGTGQLVAVGGRADAVEVLQALLHYLAERVPRPWPSRPRSKTSCPASP